MTSRLKYVYHLRVSRARRGINSDGEISIMDNLQIVMNGMDADSIKLECGGKISRHVISEGGTCSLRSCKPRLLPVTTETIRARLLPQTGLILRNFDSLLSVSSSFLTMFRRGNEIVPTATSLPGKPWEWIHQKCNILFARMKCWISKTNGFLVDKFIKASNALQKSHYLINESLVPTRIFLKKMSGYQFCRKDGNMPREWVCNQRRRPKYSHNSSIKRNQCK